MEIGAQAGRITVQNSFKVLISKESLQTNMNWGPTVTGIVQLSHCIKPNARYCSWTFTITIMQIGAQAGTNEMPNHRTSYREILVQSTLKILITNEMKFGAQAGTYTV